MMRAVGFINLVCGHMLQILNYKLKTYIYVNYILIQLLPILLEKKISATIFWKLPEKNDDDLFKSITFYIKSMSNIMNELLLCWYFVQSHYI